VYLSASSALRLDCTVPGKRVKKKTLFGKGGWPSFSVFRFSGKKFLYRIRAVEKSVAKRKIVLETRPPHAYFLPVATNGGKQQTDKRKDMYTHTSTKDAAAKIKKAVDRLASANCDIIRDGKAYRVSANTVSGTVFSRVRDMVDAGCNPSDITLEAVSL
jgi:hypothetical protein